jgi:vacuolar-type H+-ATPase subunit H
VATTPNALESIRRIESQAEGIIRDATRKAEVIKKKSLEEGEAAKKKLVDDAYKKLSEYKRKKEEESKKESADVLNKGKKESGELKETTSSRLPSAVDIITKIIIGD